MNQKFEINKQKMPQGTGKQRPEKINQTTSGPYSTSMSSKFGNGAKKENKSLYPSISTDPLLPCRCAHGACDKNFKSVKEGVAHAATHQSCVII
ncbi:hypothetical protein IW261DRAFT_1598308 [Armillaria novae-zelandiae]|uniref:C2H2-type domain-containing protein n=1 Tax=Armillaria novae-zelandiae TaxID=153914 RepID=A0AA39TUC4_9AGAR|nr:hypothetical protein IW261DRAFT_1598308 [Armillaria novae-zelandiae]